ncbi:c-type cytochrome [Telluribacter humicola]
MLVVGYLFGFRTKPQSVILNTEVPKVLDDRLELSLFSADPQIVTPIGIAIDSMDQIYVLESHTHLPPSGYKGPKFDLIKLFTDKDGDGHPERVTVFAEGLKEGLNLAFSPAGQLYAVTSREVWVLHDKDGDGVSEKREKVLELVEPASVYAHAALLGITFSPDGWMYISRGNTSGAAWKLQGTNGSAVGGYGDGGNIVRARPDGTQLEEVATGFWNPMDLKFDNRGHLLAADNDPDSRGPNRLVHVVPGGNYGYQSLYGGSGIHPYLAWNGELSSTLPFAVGLGEAPSGLLDGSTAALPTDYQGQMLASIWEESRIVRIDLKPQGASLTGSTQVIVEGSQQFRPVAFATDRKGTIYFTDWVLRDYPNHGKGRIWRLKAKLGVQVEKSRPAFNRPQLITEGNVLAKVYAASSPADFDFLKKNLQSKDPFLRHAAIQSLARPVFQEQVVEATRSSEPEVRLGAMLALQKGEYAEAVPILRRLLQDPNEQIRRQALIWVGQEGLAELRPDIDKALAVTPVSATLFETYLETIAHLSPDFINAYRQRSERYAKSIKRELPEQFIEMFVQDKNRSAALRALAIRYLPDPAGQKEVLISLLLQEKEPRLRAEAIRALATVPDESIAVALYNVAVGTSAPVQVRAEALLALSRQPVDYSDKVLVLLNDSQVDIQIEAVRYLLGYASNEKVQKALKQTLTTLQKQKASPLAQMITMALAPATTSSHARPASFNEWQSALRKGGNPERGRRVFYSNQAVCSSCHAIQGRGGDLGPDLTNVGLSKNRQQLVQSIIKPSEEISPEWQGWYIKLRNGELHQGRQIDVGDKELELYTQASGFRLFSKKDVAEYGMIKTSLMPDGLHNQLTVSELQDLLAFLESKKE